MAEILLLVGRSFLHAWGPLKRSADASAYTFHWSLCEFLCSFVQMLFCIWKSSTKEDFKSSLGELKAGAGGVTVQRRKEWVV